METDEDILIDMAIEQCDGPIAPPSNLGQLPKLEIPDAENVGDLAFSREEMKRCHT